MASESRAVLAGLRTLFDGSSVFMDGHQIVRSRTNSRKRKTPAWAKDDQQIRMLLLTSFPLLATNLTQRKRAARWMMVIQMYFREKKSYREVAEEMAEKPRTVEMLVRAVTRASKGQKANGRGVRGAVNQTSSGGANKDLSGTTQPDVRL